MDASSRHQSPTQPTGAGTGPAPPALTGYHRGRKLGSGGRASVWLVTSELNGGTFAAKVFHPPGDDDGPNVLTAEQAHRELQLLEHVAHEHLVRLHDVLETDGMPTLVMDYAPGGSLGALVGARGPLPVGEVVTLLTPIAQCLAYLHSQGITHSDVSPGNILFTELGKPLLSDLGLGRRTGENGTPQAGTSGFAGPEIVSGPRQHALHPEDDIHGLAAVGWYALTGRVPAASDRRPPLAIVVPGVPDDLAAIIVAGLESDISARPTAAEFGQGMYHSAEAAPIDLVQAVHESVRPHLLTRRNAPARKRRWPKMPLRLKPMRSGERKKSRNRKPRSRRSSGRPDAAGNLRLPVALAAVLVAVLVAWSLLGNSESAPSDSHDSRMEAGTSSTAPTTGMRAENVPKADQSGDPPASQPAETGTPGQRQTGRDKLPGVPKNVEVRLASDAPEEVVHALAWLRSYAFSSGRTGLLEYVNAPGSAAREADRAIAQRLEQTDHVLSGFESRISRSNRLPAGDGRPSVEEGVATSEQAVVAVTVHTSGYTELDARGGIVRSERPAGKQELMLVLQDVDGRWRITQILASTAGH